MIADAAKIAVIVFNFGNYQYWQSLLPLPLFMFRILADHTHHALAVHDLAFIANLLD